MSSHEGLTLIYSNLFEAEYSIRLMEHLTLYTLNKRNFRIKIISLYMFRIQTQLTMVLIENKLAKIIFHCTCVCLIEQPCNAAMFKKNILLYLLRNDGFQESSFFSLLIRPFKARNKILLVHNF